MEISRFRCEELPGVNIFGVDTGRTVVYLAQIWQLIGFLRNNTNRQWCNKVFDTFLGSEVGQGLAGRCGGDLARALQTDGLPLRHVMYSHGLSLHTRGRPSRLVTIGGIRELLRGLPGVDDGVRRRLAIMCDEHLGLSAGTSQCFTFVPAADDQCDNDDPDELVGEISTEQHDVDSGASQSLVVPARCTQAVVSNVTAAECMPSMMDAGTLALRTELLAKGEAIKMEQARTQLEQERTRLEQDRTQLERERVQMEREKAALECRVKDAEIAQLKLQLAAATTSPRAGDKRPAEVAESSSLPAAMMQSLKLPSASGSKYQWIIAYELVGDTMAQADVVRRFGQSVRWSLTVKTTMGERWLTLLHLNQKVSIVKVVEMALSVLAGHKCWVEAVEGCGTWWSFNLNRISEWGAADAMQAYMKKKLWRNDKGRGFPMVPVSV